MNFRVLDLSAHQGDIDFSRVKKRRDLGRYAQSNRRTELSQPRI